jgi:hypothetical protein
MALVAASISGKGTHQDGDGAGVGVAHGADDGKAIAGRRHVEIAEQGIEGLRADEFERAGDIAGDGDGEAPGGEDVLEDVAEGGLVIDQQDPWRGELEARALALRCGRGHNDSSSGVRRLHSRPIGFHWGKRRAGQL